MHKIHHLFSTIPVFPGQGEAERLCEMDHKGEI